MRRHRVPLVIVQRERLALTGFAVVALVLAFLLPTASPSRAAAVISADWQLQNSRANSVAGAPALTDIGSSNAFVTTTVDGVVNRPVMGWPKGGGLAVTPTSGLTNGSVYSVVVLYKPTSLPGYQRILEFTGSSGDLGLYQVSGRLSAYPSADSGIAVISDTAFNQVVLTRTAGKVVTGYVNGAQVLQFTDTANAWIIAGPTLSFFKDNIGGGAVGEEGAGQAARIRTYSTALTKSEVSGLDRLPTTATDISVKLVDSPDPVAAGNLIAYTATVLNAGPPSAAAVKAVFTVPAGATVVGSSPSAGTCATPVGATVTCTIGTLAAAKTATVLLVVTAPTTTGSITGKVVVSTTTPDNTSANDTATTKTTVR